MWPYSMLKPLYCQNKTWSMHVQTYTKDLPVFLRQKKSDAIQWTVIFTPHAEWYPWEPWGVSSLLQEGETQKVVSTPSVAHDLNLRIVNMNAHNRNLCAFIFIILKSKGGGPVCWAYPTGRETPSGCIEASRLDEGRKDDLPSDKGGGKGLVEWMDRQVSMQLDG